MNRTTFLKRLIGIAGLGFVSWTDVQQTRKILLLQSFVAGFRFHRGMALLPLMQENDILELRREPLNTHDSFAISLYWQQEMIGYLPADSNEILARLMDASALPLLGIITHLKKEAKPWENVAVAIYFLQPQQNPLPVHAAYLTRLVQPDYTTLKKEKTPGKAKLPSVLDYYDRIINPESVKEPDAKAYYEKWYGNKEIFVEGTRYLLVPDDGIYTYLYNVVETGWLTDDKGSRYLEFIWQEEE